MFPDLLIAAVAAAIAAALALRELRRARAVASRAREEAASARLAVEQLSAAQRSEPRTPERHVLTPPAPDEQLVAACAVGECVLFAGTGISAAVGQPTWREALLTVLRTSQARDPKPLWDVLAQEVGGEQYDLVADRLVAELGTAQFFDRLRDAVGSPARRTKDSTLRELAQIPFAGVIANLWDRLAAEAFSDRRPTVLDPDSTEQFAETLRSGDFFVLNAYGSLARGTLLLTAEAFENYLNDHSSYARFLGSLLGTRTIFFVGTSVAGIENLFRSAGVRSASSRRHVALVPWSAEAELHRERLLRRFNVELIPYSATAGHPEVHEFVATLRRRVAAHRRASSVVPSPSDVPLAGLRLENIGPFDEAEFEFASDWNLLVGNNGSGKSTILRAIALAVCGDDERAMRRGELLLNSNADRGSVQVRFGKDVFETTLIRERTQVRVISGQITPVQSGQWFVIGFPPVRGVTMRSPATPSAPSAREPSVEDVLPLLTSEVDGRLDDLTQWLLDSVYEYTAVERERRPVHGVPPTVARFFSVMSRLIGDREYTYAGIRRETLDVMVQTPDGEVPLNLLSQGMSSILSWTGMIITRLEEIARVADVRGPDSGLVLVDEIDAHLHPSWQRTVVGALRNEFPQLQVLATTHSPLVVGSMSTGKALRLSRDASQRVIVEELAPLYGGWRADQILSGPAFETNPRDPDTERLLEAYGRLARLADPTKEEQRRLDEVAHQLHVRMPTSEQRVEARKAREIIEAAAASQIAAINPAERDGVLAALELQIQQAITGSRPTP